MKPLYILIFCLVGLTVFLLVILLCLSNSNSLLIPSFNSMDYYKNMIQLIQPTHTQKINIPVYFINLPRSKQRLQLIQKQIKMYDIKNYHIEEAVDGNNIVPTEQPDVFKVVTKKDLIYFTNNDPIISSGEIGCTLSHLKTIIKCLDNDSEYSLICEDDVDFIRLFASNISIENVVKNAPKDWDFISIFKACNTYKDTDTEYIPYYNKYGKCWVNVAYIINKKGCRKIYNKCFLDNKFILDTNYLKDLDMGSSIGALCAADTYIQFFLNAYVYHDSLVLTQNYSVGMESTIHNSHTKGHIERSTDLLRSFYRNLIKSYNFNIPYILVITGNLNKDTKNDIISLYKNFHVIFSHNKDLIRHLIHHGGICVKYNKLEEIDLDKLIKLSNDSLNIFYSDKKIVAMSSIPNHPILNYININNKSIQNYRQYINVIDLDDSLSF